MNKPMQRPYPCRFCRSQYTREGALAQHVYLRHPQEFRVPLFYPAIRAAKGDK
jgi:hypothetical protein